MLYQYLHMTIFFFSLWFMIGNDLDFLLISEDNCNVDKAF
jgi:hypothetical protein